MTRHEIILAISEMKDCSMVEAESILSYYEVLDPDSFNAFLEDVADFWFDL